MTYFDIVNRAISTVVVTDEKTKITYLEPLYKEMLKLSDIEFNESILPMKDLYEILKLEVAKRNAMDDPTNELMHKINDFLKEKIDPVLEENNNKLIMELLDYLHKKENNELTSIKPVAGIVNFAKK